MYTNNLPIKCNFVLDLNKQFQVRNGCLEIHPRYENITKTSNIRSATALISYLRLYQKQIAFMIGVPVLDIRRSLAMLLRTVRGHIPRKSIVKKPRLHVPCGVYVAPIHDSDIIQ